MYLILNFKTYEQATGDNAVRLAEIVSKAQTPANVDLVVCPQAADIFRIREQFPDLTVWAQHVDPIDTGKNTGWTSVTSVIMAGANGTLINHSEHKLEPEEIGQVLELTKHYQLASCVAVPDLHLAQKLAALEPDILAYEPPELISTGTSLVDSDPKLAAEFVEKLSDTGIKLILGAGVADAKDATVAKALGYQGVLLASGFVMSEDPAKFLAEMIGGFAS